MNDTELYHLAKAISRAASGDVVLLERVVRDSADDIQAIAMNDDNQSTKYHDGPVWGNPVKHRPGFRQPRTSKHKHQDRQRRRWL